MSLFITMTGSPDWEEIKDFNKTGNVFDRPDIVARVFKEKSDQFLKDISDCFSVLLSNRVTVAIKQSVCFS